MRPAKPADACVARVERQMQQRRQTIDIAAPLFGAQDQVTGASQLGHLNTDGLRSYLFYEGCIEDFLKPREGSGHSRTIDELGGHR